MAYVKISDLNFAQTLTGNEFLPVVQNGTSYKVSVSAVGGTGDTENINGNGNTIDTNSIVSSVVGGCNNALSGNCSSIVGGSNNIVCQSFSSILGGTGNRVDSVGSVVAGGASNKADGYLSFIGGGTNSCINTQSRYSTIGGGGNHRIYDSECSTIGGGQTNVICCSNKSTIGGGAFNRINTAKFNDSRYGVIGGGKYNYSAAPYTSVLGGWGNYAHLSGGTVGGGRYNVLSGAYGFIGGGRSNTIKSGLIPQFGGDALISPSIIVSGRSNKIYSPNSFIGGGSCNKISDNNSSVILHGYTNCIYGGGDGFILGGSLNSLSGNTTNSNSSFRNFIGNGTSNCIIGHGDQGSKVNTILNGCYNLIGPETNPGGSKTITSSTIVGGTNNCIKSGDEMTTVGFIGGGQSNSLSGTNAMVNSINSTMSGQNNIIGAGHTIDIYGRQSFVGSGFCNTICADYSSIVTGCSNNNFHDNSHVIGSNITTVSGNMLHAQTLYLSAAGLPTADPGVPGVVWRDGTDLKISV